MNCFIRNRRIASAMFLALAAIAWVLLPNRSDLAHAQQAEPTTAPARQTHEVKNLLDPADAVVLLLDHQSGLFQTVKDISVAELRNNTTILAKMTKLLNIPIITTASVPDGPNGPLMPEIHQNAPAAIYVPRKGEISAWDNELFVETVRKTGRKTLIMAGVWTSVCVAFPAIQAKADGYNVYAVIDASGDPSPMASQVTIARLAQAGVTPITTNAVICEFQRTWNRPNAVEFGALLAATSPNYTAAVESYQKAQEVARQPKK